MKLDIIRKETYNCFQNQIAAVANYYQVDYRMMMLELWGFVYKEEENNFAERMGLIWNGKLEYRKKLLSKFHGIIIEEFNSIADIKDIEKIVDKTPIAFYIDSFDCEWLPFYQKQHRQHLCNIIEVDTLYCYCQDDYTNNIKLRIDEINERVNNILVFHKAVDTEYTNSDIRIIIEEAIENYNINKSLENMRNFVNHFTKEFCFNKEVPQGGDPICSKTIMYLKCLGDDKVNLGEFFEFLNANLGLDIYEIKKILHEQSRRFYFIRNYLIKIFFSKKNINLEIIGAELEEIFKQEQMLYKCINEIIA